MHEMRQLPMEKQALLTKVDENATDEDVQKQFLKVLNGEGNIFDTFTVHSLAQIAWYALYSKNDKIKTTAQFLYNSYYKWTEMQNGGCKL